MTYANVQELTIHQGPVQRLLGIADLKVRSAGGGSVQHEGKTVRETHVGYFHGVDNAEAIRDLILTHLRHRQDAGLGDPDEVAVLAGAAAPASPRAGGGERCAGGNGEALEAAREVLSEARSLRAVVEARRHGGP